MSGRDQGRVRTCNLYLQVEAGTECLAWKVPQQTRLWDLHLALLSFQESVLVLLFQSQYRLAWAIAREPQSYHFGRMIFVDCHSILFLVFGLFSLIILGFGHVCRFSVPGWAEGLAAKHVALRLLALTIFLAVCSYVYIARRERARVNFSPNTMR